MKRFEMLWYPNEDCNGDYITKDFSTHQAMMNFYKKHKENKFNILLTRRNADWCILEDYELPEA